MEQVEINKPELFDGEVSSNTATIALKVRGNGRFGVYSSQSPLKCAVDGSETDFIYDSETGLTTFLIPVPSEELYRWSIEIQV